MLETLILSNNMIKTISKLGLDRLPNLKRLSLDNNSLKALPPLNFFSSPKLMLLNLSHNLIKLGLILDVMVCHGFKVGHSCGLKTLSINGCVVVL